MSSTILSVLVVIIIVKIIFLVVISLPVRHYSHQKTNSGPQIHRLGVGLLFVLFPATPTGDESHPLSHFTTTVLLLHRLFYIKSGAGRYY